MLLTIEKVMLLRGVEMFSRLNGELLAEMAISLDEMELEAGEEFIGRGEFGTSMYVIASGKVGVLLEDGSVVELGPRDVVGELAALVPEVRTASARVLEDAILLGIEHSVLYEFISEHTEFAESIIAFLINRYRCALKGA